MLILFLLTITVSFTAGYYFAIKNTPPAQSPITNSVIPSSTPTPDLIKQSRALSSDFVNFLSLIPKRMTFKVYLDTRIEGRVKEIDPGRNFIALVTTDQKEYFPITLSSEELKNASIAAYASPSGLLIPYKFIYIKPWDRVHIRYIRDFITDKYSRIIMQVWPNY